MIRLLLLAFAITLASNCSNSIHLDSGNYHCQYSASYASSDCTQPTFVSCLVSPHDHAQPSFHVYTVDQCNLYCCSNPSPSNMFCSVPGSSINYLIIIIVLSIVFFFCLAFICLYRFGDDCCFRLRRCFGRNNQVLNINPSESLINDTQSNLQTLRIKKWEADPVNIQNQQCSVCLCDNPNFMLPCGHIYHQSCIFQCLRRKYECILCRRTDLTEFKLYCQRCFKRYKQVLYYELKQLEHCEQRQCDSCVQIEKLRVEIIE